MLDQHIGRIRKSMMATGIFHDEHQAMQVLRASIQALRDRLPEAEASQLGTYLPPTLREWFLEGWQPGQRQARSVNKSDFLAEVELHLKDPEEHSLTELVPVAMKEILSVIDEEEAEHIKQLLPKSMHDIFDDRISM